jgi:hypothetical protein
VECIEVIEHFWISFTLLLRMHGMNNFKTFFGSRGNKLNVAHIDIEGKANFN